MKLAALGLCLIVSCSALSGIYGVAERAAPAATGAGAGALVGGPVGAVVGAAAGSAVAQAAQGNQRTDAQADAIEDAIRGGRVSITPGMVFAEFFWWIVCIGLGLWFLRTPQTFVVKIVAWVRARLDAKRDSP